MDILQNKKGRAFLVFSLYLSEGAPIGFIWWALPTLLRNMQVNVEKITAVSALLVLPWIFKFLWAPLVDTFRSKRYGFKTWITCAQLVMALSLVPLVFIPPDTGLPYWIIFLIIHSVAAATQDVSIDAMVINSVQEHERGILNGYMQAGMLTGRSIFGTGVLLMAPSLGLQSVMLMLIACILLIMLLLFFVKEPPYTRAEGAGFSVVWKNLAESFREKNTWVVILFALVSAAGFEVAGGLAGPFLTDLNVSPKNIGIFLFLPVSASMLIGGLVGGRFSDRHSRRRSTGIFLCGFTLFAILIAGMRFIGINANGIPYYIAFAGMYFFVGMFIASSYALYMDQTNPKIGATQFSTYMAATNGCESWTVWVAGLIIARTDYSIGFFIMAVISILSLFILKRIKTAA